jgi:integrase
VKSSASLVLFAVNTGLRESNVCGLEWAWEVGVPEVGRSVLVIPPEAFKSKRAHVVVLNDAAWSIVQAQRGLDPTWVFPRRGQRLRTMNNTAWQRARQAGLLIDQQRFGVTRRGLGQRFDPRANLAADGKPAGA